LVSDRLTRQSPATIADARPSDVSTIAYFRFFFQAEDGIRDRNVTGVQTCALPILNIRLKPQWSTLIHPSPCIKPHFTCRLFIQRSEERRVGKECRSRGWRYR